MVIKDWIWFEEISKIASWQIEGWSGKAFWTRYLTIKIGYLTKENLDSTTQSAFCSVFLIKYVRSRRFLFLETTRPPKNQICTMDSVHRFRTSMPMRLLVTNFFECIDYWNKYTKTEIKISQINKTFPKICFWNI